MGIIQADIGKGKTLLMAILARSMPYGIKKVGFVSNVPDCELLSYSDINFQEKVPRKDTFRIPKYFFLDETNYYIDGVNVAANRLYHEGVSQLCQQARHQKIHLWISATRGNHVWVAVREMVNYYIKLDGLRPLFKFGSYSFFTLRIDFYSQSWKHEQSFNILVSNLDFELYDSYWLKDTALWRRKKADQDRTAQDKIWKNI
ncbi:MAG: hypothetical protein MRERV_12c006 [Mycoplasmataceae bacterium RV_VA103A]|nr:MAG: hypothetical protein MRERV_12c006 [Mycoplasmataceae bacterium RV_VA103A]